VRRALRIFAVAAYLFGAMVRQVYKDAREAIA
jgi:hypothetical protein